MSVEFAAVARPTPSGALLVLTGDLDAAASATARAVIRTVQLRPGQLLLVDLDGMGYCDSSGISTLVAARNHAVTAGAAIALAALPRQLARALNVLGMEHVFPAYPTVEQAQNGWTAGPGH